MNDDDDIFYLFEENNELKINSINKYKNLTLSDKLQPDRTFYMI